MPHDHGVDNCSHIFCKNGRQFDLGESRSPTQIFQRNLLLASHRLWVYVCALGLGLMVMMGMVIMAMVIMAMVIMAMVIMMMVIMAIVIMAMVILAMLIMAMVMTVMVMVLVMVIIVPEALGQVGWLHQR